MSPKLSRGTSRDSRGVKGGAYSVPWSQSVGSQGVEGDVREVLRGQRERLGRQNPIIRSTKMKNKSDKMI